MLLNPLPELLLGRFLPSELSSSSNSKAEEFELGADKDWLGLLLVFGLLKHSDLREPWVFFFNFLFKSWTWRFNASTVLKFSLSAVRSIEDILLFASIFLGSRTVLGFLRCRDNGSGSLGSVYISDLTTTFVRDLSEANPLGHRLSLLEDTSVLGFSIGFFLFPEYMVIFTI